jgi:hypothetical protein
VKLHIGLDLDGVFADFQRCYEELYWPYPEPLWDTYDGYRKRYTDEEFKRQIKAMGKTGSYRRLKPYPTAIATWNRLRHLPNTKLHVITHRPREAWADTVTWLEDHNLEADTLSFSSDKTIVRALGGNNADDIYMAIDDYDHHWSALSLAGVDAYLCDRPWNKTHGEITVTLSEFANHAEWHAKDIQDAL